MDFLLKFSSELLILVLSLTVAGLNLFYFGGSSFRDQSPAASLLSHHVSLNPKLGNKNNSIVTTVAQGDGFIQTAQAEDLSGLESLSSGDPVAPGSGDEVIRGDENFLFAPNPDSIQPLIEKQVKIYQTQEGDSLKSLEQKFGISQQTIIWANNLPSKTIKPGWYLLIPPVDGTIVKADANTTLPDIANTYNPERYNPNKQVREDTAAKLLDTIISYNGLADAQDIDDGQIIIVPGGVVAQPPQPAPKPKPKPKVSGDSGINTITSIGPGYEGDNHTFPVGFCTYYVAKRMKITFGGNAKNWLANAKASGYVTGQEPAAHSAVVMTGPHGAMRRFGHVAYIESVNGDGTITLSEMNYDHFNRIDTRTISIHDSSIRGYIYP